ncbi:hypothetical protein SMICM17S_09701 [Streptomyces microflavus]
MASRTLTPAQWPSAISAIRGATCFFGRPGKVCGCIPVACSRATSALVRASGSAPCSTTAASRARSSRSTDPSASG